METLQNLNDDVIKIEGWERKNDCIMDRKRILFRQMSRLYPGEFQVFMHSVFFLRIQNIA